MELSTNDFKRIYYTPGRISNFDSPHNTIANEEAKSNYEHRKVLSGFFERSDGLKYFIECGLDSIIFGLLDDSFRELAVMSLTEDEQNMMHVAYLYEFEYLPGASKTPTTNTYWTIQRNGAVAMQHSFHDEAELYGPIPDLPIPRPAFGVFDELVQLYFLARDTLHQAEREATAKK